MKEFPGLTKGKYKAILADPPWAFQTWWSGRGSKKPSPKKKFSYPSRATAPAYEVMREDELNGLPVADLAADDCVLFLWTCWPVLEWSLRTIKAWGFEYKTCGFCWVKAHAGQLEMFQEDIEPHMTLGYWTRSNSEVCLLATKGKPKRISAAVKQAIISPRREHSRKPEGIHERIECLIEGPYCELFARQRRFGWDSWGHEVDKFQSPTAAQETPSEEVAPTLAPESEIAQTAPAANPTLPPSGPNAVSLLHKLRSGLRPMRIPRLNSDALPDPEERPAE